MAISLFTVDEEGHYLYTILTCRKLPRPLIFKPLSDIAKHLRNILPYQLALQMKSSFKTEGLVLGNKYLMRF